MAINPMAQEAARHAAQLHERARELRRLATRIEELPVLRLDAEAGDDTWTGPRPALCRSTLQVNQRQLHQAADDLRWRAHRFEVEALELERRAALEAAFEAMSAAIS